MAACPAIAWSGPCSRQDLQEVASLEALPADIQPTLRDQSNGSAIADRGQAFQRGDVIHGTSLPFRRFVVAGLDAQCALVAIEHGGRAYSVGLYRFSKKEGAWTMTLKGSSFKPPALVDELAASKAMTIADHDAAHSEFEVLTTPLAD